MSLRAILSTLSSACHGAGEAFAYLMPEVDAQPAEEERAEAFSALLRALDEKNAWQLKHEELQAKFAEVTRQLSNELESTYRLLKEAKAGWRAADAERNQFRAALERAERSISSQTDEAETRALEAEDRAEMAEAERDRAHEARLCVESRETAAVAELDEARGKIAELEEELSRARDGYVPAELHEELRQSLLAVSRDLSRASYWKRGEPGEPKRLVVFWHSGRREPQHALSTHHAEWALPGWYAEALGAPPSEEAKP